MATKKSSGRTSISVSFSCPPEMKAAIDQRTRQTDLTLSQYIRSLVRNDLARLKIGAEMSL